MYEFEFVKPATVEAAIEALKDEDAQPLAGGQTLIPTLKQRLNMPSKLVSLKGITALQGVREESGTLRIGAATTHAEIARATATLFPGLASLAGRIGDPAVRNRGTIGGSIANNDPSACYPAMLMAVRGSVITNTREIPAEAYFQGMFDTALEDGELVTAISIPVPEASNYQKFEQPASRFPLCGVFVARFLDRVGVAVTGASNDGVFAWAEAEQALATDFAPAAVTALAALDGEDMIDDLHGSGAYRAHLASVLTRRAVEAMG
ncbi:FAD binding domain-containing protein [Pseudooceanicola aestuarii]|uniref:FAD binding domain-containing protein n=1 Tax=Pseudooceanicola aestuarii TaxID=2697319 RepID=UPI0013D07C4A|nr:xanthine dehydrogenase family protein subunit M [Pseudooceanicola aestuarii]